MHLCVCCKILHVQCAYLCAHVHGVGIFDTSKYFVYTIHMYFAVCIYEFEIYHLAKFSISRLHPVSESIQRGGGGVKYLYIYMYDIFFSARGGGGVIYVPMHICIYI